MTDSDTQQVDIAACLENLDTYAQAGDARSCRDIGIALAQDLAAVRGERDRLAAIVADREGTERDLLNVAAAELQPLRGLAKWLASKDWMLPALKGMTGGAETVLAEAITRARQALGRTEG